MRHAAWASLLHHRTKLLSGLAGVAFATMLLLVQLGLYEGFQRTASAVIDHVAGDLWVMANGTQVFENAEPLGPSVRWTLSSVPCVRHIRPLVSGWVRYRKSDGGTSTVLVMGYDPQWDTPLLPWTFREGVPTDLVGPGRVAVDAGDLWKLQLPDDPIGTMVRLDEEELRIVAVSEGLRSFALAPYFATNVENAARALGRGLEQPSYLVVDAEGQGCQQLVMDALRNRPDVNVIPTATFSAMTRTYWVDGSGAGASLAFSALLGMIVGGAIVGQTLFSTAKAHEGELATLKAMGARGSELVSFVLWQAVLLLTGGFALGTLAARSLSSFLTGSGLDLALTLRTFTTAGIGLLALCALAAYASVRRVLMLEAHKVLR